MTIDEALKRYKETTPDIAEHLDTLVNLAAECETVTEFGFRRGASFCALLKGNPSKLSTYDINIKPDLVDFFGSMRGETELEFNQISTLDTPPIDECDLLFIDTWHVFSQLNSELTKHGNRVKKYIVLHDTEVYSHTGEDGSQFGLIDAIAGFIMFNPHWHIMKHYPNNNGLTVLVRA